MKQAGHGDSQTPLRIYAHVMEADPVEREKLRTLIGAAAGPEIAAASVPVEWTAAEG